MCRCCGFSAFVVDVFMFIIVVVWGLVGCCGFVVSGWIETVSGFSLVRVFFEYYSVISKPFSVSHPKLIFHVRLTQYILYPNLVFYIQTLPFHLFIFFFQSKLYVFVSTPYPLYAHPSSRLIHFRIPSAKDTGKPKAY